MFNCCFFCLSDIYSVSLYCFTFQIFPDFSLCTEHWPSLQHSIACLPASCWCVKFRADYVHAIYYGEHANMYMVFVIIRHVCMEQKMNTHFIRLSACDKEAGHKTTLQSCPAVVLDSSWVSCKCKYNHGRFSCASLYSCIIIIPIDEQLLVV